MPRAKKKTAEEIAKELADMRREPFHGMGRDWQGDIFYSTISQELRRERIRDPTGDFYCKVCDLLRQQGFYVHD